MEVPPSFAEDPDLPGPSEDDPSVDAEEIEPIRIPDGDDAPVAHDLSSEAVPQSAAREDEAAELSMAPAFDIDDRLQGRRVIPVTDGSQLVIAFQALIDWTSGTGARVKLTSRTIRENPGNRVYPLRTTFRFTFVTKKLGRTTPPMEMSPMEDEWPLYGLNVLRASLKWGHYGPGSAWSARNNHVYLPFSGARLIRGTGEPRDNPLQQITVWALGGFTTGAWYATAARSAFRGGA